MGLPTHDNYHSSLRNVSKRTLTKSVLTTRLLHVLLKCHLLLSFPLLPQLLLFLSLFMFPTYARTQQSKPNVTGNVSSSVILG